MNFPILSNGSYFILDSTKIIFIIGIIRKYYMLTKSLIEFDMNLFIFLSKKNLFSLITSAVDIQHHPDFSAWLPRRAEDTQCKE